MVVLLNVRSFRIFLSACKLLQCTIYRLSNGEVVQMLRDYLEGSEGELGSSSRATLQAEGVKSRVSVRQDV